MALINIGSNITISETLPPRDSVARPVCATDGFTKLVFVWEGKLSSDSVLGIYGATYTKAVGSNSLVRETSDSHLVTSINPLDAPHVATNSQKTIAVTWTEHAVVPVVKFSVFQNDFSTQTISEILVPGGGANNKTNSKILITEQNLIVVAWLEKIGAANVVRAASYSISGNIATEINSFDLSVEGNQPSAIDLQLIGNGETDEYFAIWASTAESLGFDLIKGRKFSSNGPIGGIFVANNPASEISATSPRCAVRPFTSEFMVSWLEASSPGLYNLQWRRLRMEAPATAPVSVLPDPGIRQVTGAIATQNGDITCLPNGSFYLSWIDSTNKAVIAVEYDWTDKFPATETLVSSSADPHHGIAVNQSSNAIAGTALVRLQDFVGFLFSDASQLDISIRLVKADNEYFTYDFVPQFLNPKIIRVSGKDAEASSRLDTVFSRESNPAATNNPGSRSTTSLDAFLNNEDLMIVGGPITDSLAANLMDVANLQDSISSTEAVSIDFTRSGDGAALGTLAPYITITNQNGSFTLQRHVQLSNIIDYAVILTLKGSTSRLVLVGGIRDFGTAVGAYLLDHARQGSSSPLPANLVSSWVSKLCDHKAIVVRFVIPVVQNGDTTAAILSSIDSNSISLISPQSIRSNNP